MRRLLVNDCLTCIPGTRTFWHDLQEWFGCEFVGGDYATLAQIAGDEALAASLVIRNATWFPPLVGAHRPPTISLLQDIIAEGPQRKMQEEVIKSSRVTVFNSAYTASKYSNMTFTSVDWPPTACTIPLPVDFSVFEPQNAMGCQQALALPDGAVCWVGACQGAAGHVKGWDIFVQVVRQNPDIPFVAVLKDGAPAAVPPNLRYYVRLTHQELVRVIGACRVGLCTSRTESQHLAGIEMSACGLPLVVPNVGCYWNRRNLGGRVVVEEPTPANYSAAIRSIAKEWDRESIRNDWRGEFDKPVIKAQWTKLIEEVEGAVVDPALRNS